MPRSRLLLLVIVLALALPGCISSRAYVASSYAGWENLALPPAAEPVYSVYLIGDAGAPALDPPEPTLTLLKTRLDAEDEHAAVVFLGDNVYCCGLRDSTNLSHRRQDERRLLAQIEAVRGFKGRIVFLPGNHDWNKGRVGGLQAVNRQEQFVKDALGRDDVFLPEGGFPGPVEVELTERLTLIALDTEWWLTRNEKPYGDTGEYDLEEDANFLLQLDDVIKRNSDRDLLVAGHHPLFSNGHHAGILPLRDHVFPLTRLHPALVIPLPLIGSVYPLYVRFVGSRQNMAHPRYKALRRSLRQIFSQHAGLIYASGHEHNLQYFEDQSVRDIPLYQIVSGSGSKRSPVGPGRGAGFTYGGKGFSVLHYYGDGSVWIDMWAPDGDGSTGTLLFRSRVREPDLELVDPGIPASVEVPDYRDSTVVIAANPEYQAGLVKEIFLGSHHRDTWATPVEVPVLDMGREAGGLTPIKRGGGHQTLSLRLQGADGHQYVLRSIDKDPVAAVPVNLRGTIATEIVQDQIALIQPYGAFIIPRLAEAAGIYHTNPRPVFVPSDPRLGIYQPLFAERLMLLEERPTGDMSDVSGFGGSKDVVSAARFYREITNDNDHRVDQRAYARARLFDMLLSDWDRHAGQWHWASFEPYELDPTLQGAARTDGKIYRPIPRDRDFAFNKMNGLFPSLSKYFDPRHQDFSESYGFLKGLNLSPLVQDRRLLSALERSDWIEMADSLRAALTDEVIDEAVLAWPEPVYDLNGEETSRLLKIRRDQLTDVAEAFYALHADVVDVVGSNKHERFDVTRLDDDSTRLVVYNTSEQGEGRKELYRRVFLRDETREIRLYGLGGNDRFDVAGEVLKGIRVIAVGGAGRDVFVDRSSVHGRSEHTRFYDTATGNTWEVGEETRLTLSDNDPAVNAYDPLDYKYDYHIPLTGFRLSAT
ncbi:MAG: metallophosphoesterase, partial [Rhodothermales bacterium]